MEANIEEKLIDLYDVISRLQIAVVEFAEFHFTQDSNLSAMFVQGRAADVMVVKIYFNYERAVELCHDLAQLIREMDDTTAHNISTTRTDLLDNLHRYAQSANVPCFYHSNARLDALNGLTVALAPKIHHILDAIRKS